MSFVRPEIVAGFRRWGEALIGAALLAAGLMLLLRDERVALLFGGLLVAVGLGLSSTGIRRARQPRDGGGAGVVEVDERQITYFAPSGGGSVSVDDLVSVRVLSHGPGRPFEWLFSESPTRVLAIPSDAENAAALFDVLYALPGFDMSDAFDNGALAQGRPFVAWEKQATRLS